MKLLDGHWGCKCISLSENLMILCFVMLTYTATV